MKEALEYARDMAMTIVGILALALTLYQVIAPLPAELIIVWLAMAVAGHYLILLWLVVVLVQLNK